MAYRRFNPRLAERVETSPALATLATLAVPPLPLVQSAPEAEPPSKDMAGSSDPTIAAAKVANPANAAPDCFLADSWADDHEERAAIVEYDGGVPREWAEGLARLDRAKPPGDVPPARWQRFLDDAGRFCDEWAGRAVALGWTPLDLFGADRWAPYGRIDQSGLVWLLDGCPIVLLTGNSAVLDAGRGSQLTFRRRPDRPGRALAWEIAP